MILGLLEANIVLEGHSIRTRRDSSNLQILMIQINSVMLISISGMPEQISDLLAVRILDMSHQMLDILEVTIMGHRFIVGKIQSKISPDSNRFHSSVERAQLGVLTNSSFHGFHSFIVSDLVKGSYRQIALRWYARRLLQDAMLGVQTDPMALQDLEVHSQHECCISIYDVGFVILKTTMPSVERYCRESN